MFFKVAFHCVANKELCKLPLENLLTIFPLFSLVYIYLCAKLPQNCQGLKVEEVRPFDVTLLLGIQRRKLGQDLLFLLISQVLLKLLLGHKVAVLQQLV